MTLDLGSLFATVDIITAPFDRKYTAIVGRMRALGTEAERGSSGVRVLDRSMLAAAASADKASTSTTRLSQSEQRAAAASEKAAAAARLRSDAESRMAGILGMVAGESTKVQQATLRQAAAAERAAIATGEGNREFVRQASAMSTLIGTTRNLERAQMEGAAATRGVARANEEAAATSHRFGTGMIGTARDLGLMFGAIEIGKKALDIGKEANTYQADMVRIRALTGASKAEITSMSGALLKMSGKVATAPDELATSLYHAEAIGLRSAKALGLVRAAAEGAKIGNADLEETTNALTSTVASGISKNQSYAKTMSQLLTIVGTGDMKLSDFNDSLSSGLLTIMSTYGVSLKDVGAAIATFGDNNIRGAHAATMLRIAVQSLASPGVGKRSQAALDQLGTSADELQTALQKGGLNGALSLLRKRIDQSGISANQVGNIITEAFTKRGAQGINVLLRQYDRLQSKYAQLDHGALTFGQRWQAATHTASFALSSLWTKIEAGGITIASKLTPKVAAAATWLGHALPQAAHALADALGPVIHLIGESWSASWHVFLAVAKPAVGVLSGIAHFLHEHQTILPGVTAMVLGMWAAWKGAAIVMGTLRALNGALVTFRLRQMMAGEAAGGFLSKLSPMTVAMGGLGIAIGAAVVGWQEHERAIQHNEALIQGYTQAVQQDSDAIGTNTRTMVANNLAKADAFKWGTDLGISQRTLTDAVLGNKDAIAEVNYAMMQGKKAGGDLSSEVDLLSMVVRGANAQVKQGAQNALDIAAATGKYAHAQRMANPVIAQGDDGVRMLGGGLAVAAKHARDHADATNKDSAAQKALTVVTNHLSDVMRIAGGRASQSTMDLLKAVEAFQKSEGNASDRAALIGQTLVSANGDALAFAAGMNAAASASKTFGTDVKSNAKQAKESTDAYLGSIINLKTGTIDYSKAAAAPLISDLQSMQSSAMQAAQAMYQHKVQTEGAKQAATDAYNVYKAQTQGALIDEATKLGLTAGQAKKLADQYFGLKNSGNIKKTIQAEGADKLATVLDKIGRLLAHLTGQQWNINIHRSIQTTTSGGAGGSMIGIPQAVGTQAAFGRKTIPPNTAFTVGERGWEGGVTDSQGRASIFSNAQSKAMGFRAPKAYANGTGLMGYVTGAGFRGDAANTMAAIDMAESGGKANAHNYNPSTHDDSYGLGQINLWGSLRSRLRQFGLSSPAALYNPATNMRVAYALSHGGRDFSPWSTYNSGAYLRFLGANGTVSGAHGGAGGGTGSTAAVHGKSYGGITYSSHRAAMNAAARDTRSAADSRASSAISGISLDKTTFRYAQFTNQVSKATAALQAAIDAGATRSEIASLRARLHKAEQKGKALERYLGGLLKHDALTLGHDASQRLEIHNGKLVGSYASRGDIAGELRGLDGMLIRAGVPASFIKGLRAENRQILDDVTARNKAARALARANAALVHARQVKHQDFVSFRQAGMGSFLTAAADSVTGKVTGGSILAGKRQEINRARAFFAGIRKLAKKLPRSIVRHLYEEGPDNGGLEEVQAYLGMSGAELRELRKETAEENRIVNHGAAAGAHYLDQGAVNKAAKAQRDAARNERKAQHKLMHDMHHEMVEIRHELRTLKLTTKLDAGDLALVVSTGNNRNAAKTRGHHRAATP